MNAKDRKLRDLTVQIDLFSVAKLRSRDEAAINDAGFNRGGRGFLRLAFAMDRCIYCDVNIKCCTIICQVKLPTEASLRRLRACLFIRLKTDTFGHALLQHSPLQVGAQVVYLLIGLKRDIPFRHSWSGVVTKEKLQAIFKM